MGEEKGLREEKRRRIERRSTGEEEKMEIEIEEKDRDGDKER